MQLHGRNGGQSATYMKGISVIICCYNSESRLVPTLKHLAGQTFNSQVAWELIVVDNNSSDHTGSVATEFAASNKHVDCKVVEEKQAGLSHARKKGFDVSRYEYILYCDDDNWLNSSYIERAFNIMESNPNVAVLGGHGEPECEITPPHWFDDFKTYYATGAQGKTSGDITEVKGYVYGAGSIYRRSALQDLFDKGFAGLLDDRKGKSLSSGGDVELCNALALSGYRIWYDQTLLFQHFIPKERLNWQYIVKLHDGYLKNLSVLAAYRYAITRNKGFYLLWWKDIYYYSLQLLKILYRYKRFQIKKENEKFRLLMNYKGRTIFSLLVNVFAIRKNTVEIRRSQWISKNGKA
ncbi:glycosyltransferase [Pseudobacter ginsenosidimutans]|uniref:GT2 family glycosyltransferase n=1 Tax=Pseudobacter ginsenosidimutans TaxID=661488 RepID=A0A4Q7MVZ6_9BACT|nr:glycosyltransferase [Pseudobacter ginsenosidimutans]RZS72209.1 GT2 family glycosyltransferase [Pseudobacter ginsenosidimutans]